MKTLLAQIQQRGCKEDFQPDPALLKDGQVSLYCILLSLFPVFLVNLGPFQR